MLHTADTTDKRNLGPYNVTISFFSYSNIKLVFCGSPNSRIAWNGNLEENTELLEENTFPVPFV
jgi:hypothetical protein